MKKTYTIEDAKRLAIQEAERKIASNKLFSSDDESPASEDFTTGDPETLYSLASLYAQFVEGDDYNNACDALIDTLQERFPNYI